MRTSRLSLLLALALSAHASAFAGDVSLFSGPDMTGRETVVRADMSNLQQVGFNDSAMSMVVHSGRWEVCVHADFGGECRVFDQGQYRNLDRFSRQISSLRELDSDRGERGNRGRGRGRDRDPSLTVYEGQDMRGRSISLRNDASSFVPLGFNDQAQSMVVRGGSWELCQHAEFRGDCRVFPPGEYRSLDRSFHRAISSARRVDGGNDDRGGRYEQRDGYGGGRGSALEMYTERGFGGQRVNINDSIRTMAGDRLDDNTSSIVIHEGQWEFCQHPDFGGRCITLGPGRHDGLGKMNKQITSLRRVR
jgi:hypothetical protein